MRKSIINYKVNKIRSYMQITTYFFQKYYFIHRNVRLLGYLCAIFSWCLNTIFSLLKIFYKYFFIWINYYYNKIKFTKQICNSWRKLWKWTKSQRKRKLVFVVTLSLLLLSCVHLKTFYKFKCMACNTHKHTRTL